jgi:hypothetical protein
VFFGHRDQILELTQRHEQIIWALEEAGLCLTGLLRATMDVC